MVSHLVRAARLGALVLWLMAPAVTAAELYAADGVQLNWDNTLRYGNAVRISGKAGRLLANPNGDDGDRDFAAGIVSNRLDLISELDLASGDFGLHASAAAWYDGAYHRATDNRSQATYNATTAPSSRFAPDVRNLQGQYAELDDAFLYGSADLGGIALSARLGRQTLLWGESLFYDANAIASAQAPTDYTRPIAAEDGYSSLGYLPVTQLSGTVQISPDLALSFYDQFEARAARVAGDGSYLSYIDYIGPGAAKLFLPSGRYLLRGNDGHVSAGGQYGGALHATLAGLDLGLYALRYNARDPQIILAPGSGTDDPQAAGLYRLVYPKGITLFGASLNATLGDSTIAGEISTRHDTPLVPYEQYLAAPAGGAPSAAYAKGDLLHLQGSETMTFGRSEFWDSADASLELAADDVTEVRQGNPDFDHFAAKGRLLLEPHYFQLLPDLDITLPLGLGYNFSGHGFSYYAQNAGTGDFELGVSALYRTVWKASLTLNGFIGSPDRQPLADRNFIALSLERTF